MFMGLQTTIIQVVLYSKMILVLFLVQPYFPEIKLSITKRFSEKKSFTPLNHILFVLYGTILLVLLDSLYKLNFKNSAVLHYQAESNFYISLFTLFLGYILPSIVHLVNTMFTFEQMNKQNMKQHGNSMSFINKVIADAKSDKEKNEKLSKEVEELRLKIKENSGLIAEIENNKQAYLKLKDKYEKLREEKLGDSRKQK